MKRIFVCSLVFSSAVHGQLVINEALFDPAFDTDANADGLTSTQDDEFVEIVNTGATTVDLSGYTLRDAGGGEFAFPGGTMIAANGVVLVFGGGMPAATLNGAAVFTGLPSLNNGGDTITLRDGAETTVDSVMWTGAEASDESLTRSPELTGSFVPHSSIAGVVDTESPGLQSDGSLFDPNAPEITLDPTTIMINESGASNSATVTITLSAVPASYPFTINLSNGNVAEVSVPESVDVTSGTMATFTVTAIDDSNPDGSQELTIVASAPGYQSASLTATVADDGDTGTPSTSDLLITQYYEGSSFNKYLELTNVGATELDISVYTLTRWTNAATEDWKTAGNGPSEQEALSGLLSPGASFIVADARAASPILAADVDLVSATASFNGDDSLVLYNGTPDDPANIVDAITFTDAGNEGANTSFTRKNNFVGYNLDAGSNVLDALFTWEEVATSVVDGSSLGDDAFLGSSVLGTDSTVISFSVASAVVNEDAGTVDVIVRIVKPDGVAVSVDVAFDAGSSSAELADIGMFSTQTINFPASAMDGDTQAVTVTLTNDTDAEDTETAGFILENLSSAGSAVIQGIESFVLSIQDDDTVIPDLYISELADPSDNSDARFVEIYNPTAEAVDLAAGNWNLVVYFNANASGTDIPLTGTVPAMGTFVIARNLDDYSFAYTASPPPDQINSAINFNGNDNVELRFNGGQTSGILRDVYGMPGTDGDGQPWFFEDSRVSRLPTITAPNATYTSAEWAITAGGVGIMTPGTLSDDPPELPGIGIRSFVFDVAAGKGVITFEEDGISFYALEVSADLNQSDVWSANGITVDTEDDNLDGTFTYNFTDSGATGTTRRFYRIVQQAP